LADRELRCVQIQIVVAEEVLEAVDQIAQHLIKEPLLQLWSQVFPEVVLFERDVHRKSLRHDRLVERFVI